MDRTDMGDNSLDAHVQHFLCGLHVRLGLHQLAELDYSQPERTIAIVRELQERVLAERRVAQALQNLATTANTSPHLANSASMPGTCLLQRSETAVQ